MKTAKTTKMTSNAHGLAISLLLLSALGALLFVVRVFSSDGIRYWFLLWNLLLAWVPLGLAYLLHKNLKKFRWQHWSNIGLTFLWLGFLPNSFYLISDLIHLHDSGEVGYLFDVVMFMVLILAGMCSGYISMLIVHHNLLKRWRHKISHGIIALTILATSFAIYLGRSLRWNTWDVLVNPFGILFDISERFVRPSTSDELLGITILFFMLIGSMYMVIWQSLIFVRKLIK